MILLPKIKEIHIHLTNNKKIPYSVVANRTYKDTIDAIKSANNNSLGVVHTYITYFCDLLFADTVIVHYEIRPGVETKLSITKKTLPTLIESYNHDIPSDQPEALYKYNYIDQEIENGTMEQFVFDYTGFVVEVEN